VSDTVRVLIVGTGGMARKHVTTYADIEGVEVVAGVDTNAANLKSFCDEFAIPHRFANVTEALDWGDFDAVSNVTPDGVHHATTIPLLEAKKHVLCEKPLASNFKDAQEMAEKAKSAGVVHSVNLSYREVPAMRHAAQLVADGAIGEVRHFEASYLQSWLTQPAWGDWKSEPQWLWRLSSKHGSTGVLGDVGIHILDFATFVTGSLPSQVSSQLHTFDKAPGNTIGDYALDANDSFVMHMQLENGALGTISATRFASGHHNDLRLRIYGDKGGIEVLFEKQNSRLNVCMGNNLETAQWEEIPCPDVATNYASFISAVRSGQQVDPDFGRGAVLQKFLDAELLRHCEQLQT